jgi:hypothetical protein
VFGVWWGGVAFMQLDVAALRQLISTHASPLATIAAAAGGTLVILFALGGVWAYWPEPHEIAADPADSVAVGGPAFTPVVMSPRTATAAAAFSESGEPVSTRYDDLQRQDDRSLARAVQRELKRAGCYDGPVNGAWSPSTRKAMSEFTGLVNARLPVDHPDPILLVLLETHDKVSCAGAARMAPPSPEGETASIEDGDRGLDARAGARHDVPDPATSRTASAEPEQASAPGGIMAVGAAGAAAFTAAAVAPSDKSSLGEPRATEPKRTARKYRKPSLSREVSKGFKNIQRSLNKIFW